MGDKYVAILNSAGGTMTFPAFVAACQSQGVDARLWLRAKHEGKLFSWLDGKGGHVLSVSPRPQGSVSNG